MKKQIDKIKENGATFTPKVLADYLAKSILKYTDKASSYCILDPACGDGALLHSISSILHKHKIELQGYDTDLEYINKAKQNLAETESVSVSLYNQDFLSISPNNQDLFSSEQKYNFADIVIANPPYVRTQTLGADKAQKLSKDFNLSGRIDLYYPFLMAMTNALKTGGILGVITSNRYICTKSGADIRKFLYDNYSVLEIIDLGDTKLFDAAVLPAIFIGVKKNRRTTSTIIPKFKSIYETSKSCNNGTPCNSIFEILETEDPGIYSVGNVCYEYKTGTLNATENKTDTWQLVTKKDEKWLDIIQKNTSFRIKDRFKVRVGVKSCADNIFISQLWDKEGFAIETKILKPMLSQENINTWSIDREAIQSVIYPHYSQDGKRKVYDLNDFPIAAQYFSIHREQLESRSYLKKANRYWYEFWVPQDPTLWNLPKIVFPDISVKPRFCYDESGAIVNGNCYWICATNKDEKNLLFLIEGVCNSTLMEKYHDTKFNNKLYSGRRRYLSQYIEQYPMPDINSPESQQIVSLVQRINETKDSKEKEIIASQIDSLVYQAFGLFGLKTDFPLCDSKNDIGIAL